MQNTPHPLEILDVHLKRINYTQTVQEQVFHRMISGQEQIAEKYRAQGEGKKQEILGRQVKRKKENMSEKLHWMKQFLLLFEIWVQSPVRFLV